MKKIIILCILCFIGFNIKAQTLYIFGGENHDVFLGCLNCNTYTSNSIWNEYGTYGNHYSITSIWNEYGTYGSTYSSLSPWNSYAIHLLSLMKMETSMVILLLIYIIVKERHFNWH